MVSRWPTLVLPSASAGESFLATLQELYLEQCGISDFHLNSFCQPWASASSSHPFSLCVKLPLHGHNGEDAAYTLPDCPVYGELYTVPQRVSALRGSSKQVDLPSAGLNCWNSEGLGTSQDHLICFTPCPHCGDNTSVILSPSYTAITLLLSWVHRWKAFFWVLGNWNLDKVHCEGKTDPWCQTSSMWMWKENVILKAARLQGGNAVSVVMAYLVDMCPVEFEIGTWISLGGLEVETHMLKLIPVDGLQRNCQK